MVRHSNTHIPSATGLFLTFLTLSSAFQLPNGFLLARQNTVPSVSGTDPSGTGGGGPSGQSPSNTTPTITGGNTSPTPPTVTPPTVTPPTVTPPTVTRTQDTPTIPSQPPTVTNTLSRSTITSLSPTTITSAPPSTRTEQNPSDVTNTIESTVTASNSEPVPETLTTIVFTSDGRVISSVTRTPLPSATSKPGLAVGSDIDSPSLSSMSKKVIGGVIGGIGGTLLLAGIAFVVYRVWGKKKHQRVTQDDDFFGGSSESIAAQKTGTVGSNNAGIRGSGWGVSSLTNKFSEPLDRYKSPGTPGSLSAGYKSPMSVNTASNF